MRMNKLFFILFPYIHVRPFLSAQSTAINIQPGAVSAGLSPGSGPNSRSRRGAERGVRLVRDPAVRQGLLQFGKARVGDMGVAETEPFQMGHLHKIFQSRVHVGARKTSYFFSSACCALVCVSVS